MKLKLKDTLKIFYVTFGFAAFGLVITAYYPSQYRGLIETVIITFLLCWSTEKILSTYYLRTGKIALGILLSNIVNVSLGILLKHFFAIIPFISLKDLLAHIFIIVSFTTILGISLSKILIAIDNDLSEKLAKFKEKNNFK